MQLVDQTKILARTVCFLLLQLFQMSQIDSHIRLIQEKLAGEGSEFSYEEVEEVFKVLRDASLKLIVTNVPRAVFTNEIARVWFLFYLLVSQNAFENHFRSYDPHSTFFYLSSFNRAQVSLARSLFAFTLYNTSYGYLKLISTSP